MLEEYFSYFQTQQFLSLVLLCWPFLRTEVGYLCSMSFRRKSWPNESLDS